MDLHDTQTNSHTVGVVHNWSGRNSEGYPAMSALLAARYGPDHAGGVPELRRLLEHAEAWRAIRG